jgi:hypothetical protein
MLLVQPSQARAVYVGHPTQTSLDSSEIRHLPTSSSNNSTTNTSAIGVGTVKALKQEQCDLSQLPFDHHSFPNYTPFALNTLMLHQGFAESPAALNAYYASQLPQTAFVPSSSADYYHHHHHPSMYASSSTPL